MPRLRELKSKSISELALSGSIISKLFKASIKTIGDLAALCEREVLFIDGIGEKRLDDIRKALAKIGLTFAYDPYESKVCSRHNKRRNDTRIRSYFLCESCAKEFERKALNNSQPIFKVDVAGGTYYCSHCNEKKRLSVYQWYACDVCDRVLKSIGRGIEADRGVINWWSQVKNGVQYPLVLVETDKPKLSPVNNGADYNLDFNWLYGGATLFGAEIKTGRNHLIGGSIGSGMSQFQLDVSDIEAVLISMEKQDPFIPAYVFHCQVVDIPKPPTTKFDCVGIWWTSIDELINNIEQIKQRPRENRPAAYIKTSVFKEINSFVEEINAKGYTTCSDPSTLRQVLQSKNANP